MKYITFINCLEFFFVLDKKFLFYFGVILLSFISISGVSASFNETSVCDVDEINVECNYSAQNDVDLNYDVSCDENLDGYGGHDVALISDNCIGNISNEGSAEIMATKIKTTITASNLIKYYRDSSNVHAYLKDSNGNPLGGKKVIFKISSKSYERTTNSKGLAVLGIAHKPGIYSVDISFSASGYVSSKKTITVTVKTMPTSLSFNSYTFDYGEHSVLKTILKDKNANPLANKTGIFTFNGKNYTRVSNSKGEFFCGIQPLPGNYQAKFTFKETGYATSTKTVNVIINPLKASLKVNDLTFNYCDGGILNVYLKNSGGKALGGAEVTFNISNEIHKVTSNSNGIASLIINKHPGNYSVFVSLTEKGYVSVNKTVNVLITGVVSPVVNVSGGFYDCDNLVVNFSTGAFDHVVYCSVDNGQSWYHEYGDLIINFGIGNWSVLYFSSLNGVNSSLYSCNFIVDGSAPIVWVSNGSGIYNNGFFINLTAIDYFDENPQIYYTLDGSIPTVNSNRYFSSIYISNNCNLRFFSRDNLGHDSEIVSVYYFLNEYVVNLNRGIHSVCIQDIIDDSLTVDGDVLELKNSVFDEHICLDKSLTIVGNYSTLNGVVDIYANNVTLFNLNINGAVKIFGENCSIINCNIDGYYQDLCVEISNSYVKVINCNLTAPNQGIAFDIRDCDNIFIMGCIIYSVYGSYFYGVNNSYFADNIFSSYYYDDGFNTIKLGNSFNNVFYRNNLSYGINLVGSGNNTFYSNWFCGNYGCLVSIDCPDLWNNFYLNFISKLSGSCSCIQISQDSHTVLNNNFWGVLDPLAVVECNHSDVVLENMVSLDFYVGSYKVSDGIIYGVDLICDLTHNSDGVDLSNIGYLPDGVLINFSNGNELKYSYLVGGKSTVYFDMDVENGNLFGVNVMNISKNLFVNSSAKVHVNVLSTALCNGDYLNSTYEFVLNESVDWLTLIYSHVGNFTSEVDLVLNGEIVLNFTVVNSYYVYLKSLGLFNDNFFAAIEMYNDFLYNQFSGAKADFYVYYALSFGIYDFNQLDGIINNQFVFPEFVEMVCRSINVSKKEVLLLLIKNHFNLSDSDIGYVDLIHDRFYDDIYLNLDYPGDISRVYHVNSDGEDINIDFPGGEVSYMSRINYVNGAYGHLDNVTSADNILEYIYCNGSIRYIGSNRMGHFVNSCYDGLLSYTFVCDKVDDDVLDYWLDVGEGYEFGLLKSAYGSFLTGLLTYYCIDKTADIAADKFNVSWSRSSPICISMYDVRNITVLSGRSDFRFGMDVVGSEEGIRCFNFAVSSSFSQIEYWVMHALFPDNGLMGSVTYGLSSLLFNGSVLEFIFEDDFFVIRQEGNNSRFLVIELDSGMCKDVMINVSGSYCYCLQQTDWALDFARSLRAIENVTWQILEWGCDCLDGFDDTVLGIAGGMAISVGVGLLLSNPIGWGVIAGAVLLIGAGIVADYFANDLNKGWNYKRSFHFLFDVVTSFIPANGVLSVFKGTAGRVGKIMVLGQDVAYITKKSYDEGVGKLLLDYASKNNGFVDDSIAVVRYGTIESALATAYGNTGEEVLKELDKFLSHTIYGMLFDEYISKFLWGEN